MLRVEIVRLGFRRTKELNARIHALEASGATISRIVYISSNEGDITEAVIEYQIYCEED